MRARGQAEVYFRDIIFQQHFSELTISLKKKKNKVDSSYKLFKLTPDQIIAEANMADRQQCNSMCQNKSNS